MTMCATAETEPEIRFIEVEDGCSISPLVRTT
jgi:hypothetical protein